MPEVSLLDIGEAPILFGQHSAARYSAPLNLGLTGQKLRIDPTAREIVSFHWGLKAYDHL